MELCKKLLWIGDAACGSGFGRASHYILKHLNGTYDVSVLGVNYTGDPHDEGYDIYPAWVGGDPLGIKRLGALLTQIKPDVIVVQCNPWNVPNYLKVIREQGRPYTPTVGIIAVEGRNCEGYKLNKLDHAIFWNEFSQNEAIAGGMLIPSAVIPLGVDLTVFSPGDRREARKNLGLPERCWDAFIFGNVNRNQHRKRLDLTIQYFAKFIRRYGIDDAYVCFHALQGATVQTDLEQLAHFWGRDEKHPYGVQDRLILHGAENHFTGYTEKQVNEIYRSFDVQVSTSLGEGWGLTAMEGMACGIPQIGGDYAAFGEWAKHSMYLIPCPMEGVMPDVHVMIGGTPDEEEYIEAMYRLYRNPSLRAQYSQFGLECASDPRYRWEHISTRFAEEIDRAYSAQFRGHEAATGKPA